jgi:hypothetical protein
MCTVKEQRMWKTWIWKNLQMKSTAGFLDELKAVGCDTAKSVLELEVSDLVNRTDLEEETVKEVMRILRSEFE